MFSGSIVALVTPFDKDNQFDEQAYADLVEFHIANGTHGLVPCGTTGESATLTHEEHQRAVQICVETAKGRVPVIAGAGSNATHESIGLAQHALNCGADGILVVSPYYNKPTQEGIYQHYKAINDAVDIPIILYNVPSRTVSEIEVDTVLRLAELPNVAGIKDASVDLSRPVKMRVELGEDFCLLSGEDPTALAYLAQGGQGCISVTANVAPGSCAAMHNAWQAGDVKKAQEINNKLYPLHDAMFCETNPIPAKYSVAKLGYGSDAVRLPLVSLTEAGQKQVDKALSLAGVL
jgi:4-hydroxy-tetrahydrodipicolinate synthase